MPSFWLGDGDDDVYAGAGDDVLEGEAGDDALRGDDGDDKIRGGPSVNGDGIRGGLGADEIWNGEGGGSVTTGTGGSEETDESTNIVHGYASPPGRHNPYNGALGKDIFLLGGGDDIVTPSGGNDEVNVGNGANTVHASAGDDTLVGGEGKDQVSGGPGNDVVDGRGGDDGVFGQEGDNVRADIESVPLPGSDPDPVPPTVSASPVTVADGGAGASTPARFTVRLRAASATPVPATWTASDGTATAGSDYLGAGGSVDVPAGALEATFDLNVLGGLVDEPDETAVVTVSGSANSAQATLTILDDDVPVVGPPPVVRPTVSVSSASTKEGKKGQRTLALRVTLSKATSVPVGVRVATKDQTAKAGKDYVKAAQKLTFAPGKTTLTFRVKVKGDKAKEKTEKFRVLLSGVSNGSLGRTGVGTIVNDDR